MGVVEEVGDLHGRLVAVADRVIAIPFVGGIKAKGGGLFEAPVQFGHKPIPPQDFAVSQH